MLQIWHSRFSFMWWTLQEKVLCDALLTRLRDQRPFTCEVVVDDGACRTSGSQHQRARLRKLQEAGASVCVAAGLSGVPVFGRRGHPGIMHAKAVVIDSSVAFCGSANLTMASRCNREICFRIVGPPVAQIMAALGAARAAAVSRRLP